ncbi:MAG: repeat protein [Myxococcaceae bacterium]|nr:repeat protein [Myxococcaceae bacterium]
MYHFRRVDRQTALATALSVLALAFGGAGCATASATDKAMSLTRQHREDEAIATLRKDLAEHPDDLAARRLLVRLLAFRGDLTGARAEVDALEKRLPAGDPTPLVELGHAYELTHRFEEALAAYDAASAIAPTSAVGPREGGMRCARWGEVEEARPRLEEAVRRGARDAEMWHALGLVRLHLKDLAAAEEAYRAGVAAASIEPEHAGDIAAAENLLGLATVAVLKEDAPGALAAYDALLAQRPRFGPGELGRAWALAKLGKKDDARRALDRAEELGAPRAAVAKQRAQLSD